ncbi:spore germination protein [Paenibacillus sp. N4]|uniref:GerAB/ArcD/ProY family transporter n=1 Tax=Paenibacillus vietnamensis TaxID=2590547 RepID=UPI001CD08B22|nr:GerAB/ArcD/ProY family transporter [Paenibacillus vietnamensis]MCA0754214.1 spore germination protein [Paenibacillus vietnamensis]
MRKELLSIEKQTISHFQIGLLFYVFMTGSSIINVPGALIGKAGNGAWISLLVSGTAGFCILSMLLHLHRRFPGLSYVEYSRKLIGNTLTVLLSIITLSFLFQMQAAIVLDVGIFMISSMMRETPMYAFTLSIFLIAALTARAGIEIMIRMFTIIVFSTAFLLAAIYVLAIPDYHVSFLLPVLPKGIKPVLSGAYFTFGFPYSEVFLFGMLLPFVIKGPVKKLSKTMMLSFVMNVVVLCITTVCVIMVFGAHAADRPYALFAMARIVEFLEIIERIESVIGMSLILGSYMKATITLYVLSLFISQVFKLKSNKAIILPLALFGSLMGLVNYDGATQWINMVTVIHPVWAGLAFVMPLSLLTVVSLFRKKIKQDP